MLKVAFFQGEDARGLHALPLFGPADRVFEKTAAPLLLPEVSRYIASLRPRPDAQYVLLNAMGAGEYWGSNINGDHFPEAALIHAPNEWTGNPLLDKEKARDWAYGYPTFYFAHPYAHHRNKDATRAFGEVELAAWNPAMKRVELVARVDEDKCQRFGGVEVWDKLKAGQYPDVSMGCAPAGTRILQANGQHRQIEDVQVGDMVLSHRGRAQRVETVMRRHYRGTLYRFKVYGFRRELPVTDEHPLWLVRAEELSCEPSPAQVNKGRKQRHCTPLVKDVSKGCVGCVTEPKYAFNWVRADQAEVGDYLAFPVPQHLDQTIQSLDEARLLGFYLAEGFVRNYNDRPLEQITFCLGFEEKELAQEIEDISRRLGAAVVWHDEQPAKGGRYVHVVHKDLAQRCLAFCGMYSREKVVSKEVLYMSTALQVAFLGAYLDGDGGTYKGAAYFSTSSEQLADQLFIMLARCGVIAGVNKIEHHPSEKSVVRKDTTEYQVWVGTDFSLRLGPYTRKPVYPSRKIRGQRFFYYKDDGDIYLMAPIMEIEEEDFDDDVFNFSVEEDDSYVAELLATHNCKVPYDTCSICLDWDLYRRAQATFSPERDKSPGDAVLRYHRALIKKNGKGIRGVSITRVDYCEHAKNNMNKILPDGRKVFVYNDYPRFFDISFVFIGADKTAKVMMKVAGDSRLWSLPSAELAEKLGYDSTDEVLLPAFTAGGATETKVASAPDEMLKMAFLGKAARDKDAEIVKDTIPSQFAGKAIPALTQSEKDLPKDLLDVLGGAPLEEALSTTAGLGMVLRPREFQRIILIQMGHRALADGLEADGKVFPKSQDKLDVPMGPEFFSPILAHLLAPLMAGRSALGPNIESRVLVASATPKEKRGATSSLSSGVLRKMSAAYNAYRDGIVELVAHTQDLVASLPPEWHLQKIAGAATHEVFTPLTVQYFKLAFWDEVPPDTSATVERGHPSRNTSAQKQTAGGYS
jgi:intein/homing endonuclease